MVQAIASPSTRRLARQNGIDLDALAADLGTNTVTRADLERSTGPAPAPPRSGPWDVDHAAFGPVVAEPRSRFDRLAAGNLAAGQQQIPAVTHHDRADVSAIEAARARFRDQAEARGARLTALAFHVKALARTLQAFPRFNASLSADGETLWRKGYVSIGIAVDTPHGLMVPVLREADRKGLLAIAAEIAELAGRARARKIRPEEMSGASMSITNLGGVGGRAFTPRINPPEVAILGITRTEIAPVWDGSAFQPVAMAPLDLSYDHRVINGAEAARFLAHYAGLIAAPDRLLF